MIDAPRATLREMASQLVTDARTYPNDVTRLINAFADAVQLDTTSELAQLRYFSAQVVIQRDEALRQLQAVQSQGAAQLKWDVEDAHARRIAAEERLAEGAVRLTALERERDALKASRGEWQIRAEDNQRLADRLGADLAACVSKLKRVEEDFDFNSFMGHLKGTEQSWDATKFELAACVSRLTALEAENAKLRDDAEYWQLVSEGIKHSHQCPNNAAAGNPEGMPPCDRCRAEQAEADLAACVSKLTMLSLPLSEQLDAALDAILNEVRVIKRDRGEEAALRGILETLTASCVSRLTELQRPASGAHADAVDKSKESTGTQHWAVTVHRNGESVVTIETNCLSGRDLSEEDQRVIRLAGEHLTAFVGTDKAADDLAILYHGCIIEIAVRNQSGSVSDYMNHWEGRALKAEAELESCVSRLRAQHAQIEWQPIATAPASGDVLLFGKTYYARVGVFIGHRDAEYWELRDGGGLVEPTHWIPLPDPPIAAAIRSETP